MWHVTGDRRQATGDRWQVTLSVGWTFSENFSSLPLPVWDWQCLEDIWTKGSVSHSISDGGDCRTVPATPGLLIMALHYPGQKSKIWGWWFTHGGKWCVYTKRMFCQNFRIFKKKLAKRQRTFSLQWDFSWQKSPKTYIFFLGTQLIYMSWILATTDRVFA